MEDNKNGEKEEVTVWGAPRVAILASNLDHLFGPDTARKLKKAQGKADGKLVEGVKRSSEDYKHIGARWNEFADELLRIDGRLWIPKSFKMRNRAFYLTLIEFTNVDRVHVGVRGTLAGLAGFVRDGMYRDVVNFVKACDECQRAKHRTALPEGTHRAMPIRVAGFKDIAWDVMGPLPPCKTCDGVEKTGIWTLLARGTGYVLMVPIRHDIDAPGLAEVFVERIDPTTGIPETVLSDRDPKFTSAFWTAVVQLLQTTQLLTTSFHPRTDGGVEGKHGIINIAMRTIVDSKQSNWISCIPHVQFRLNATPSFTTGYSPFELTMGYIPTAFPMAADYSLDTAQEVRLFMEHNDLARRTTEDAIKLARLKQTE